MMQRSRRCRPLLDQSSRMKSRLTQSYTDEASTAELQQDKTMAEESAKEVHEGAQGGMATKEAHEVDEGRTVPAGEASETKKAKAGNVGRALAPFKKASK